MEPQASPAFKDEIRRNIAELDQLIDEILLASRLDAKETDIGTPRGGGHHRPCGRRVRAGRRRAGPEQRPQARGGARRRQAAAARLRNLLENARRYSGGPVTVELSAKAITRWCACAIAGRGCRRKNASASSSRSIAWRVPASASVVSAWAWRWCARSPSATTVRRTAKTTTAPAHASCCASPVIKFKEPPPFRGCQSGRQRLQSLHRCHTKAPQQINQGFSRVSQRRPSQDFYTATARWLFFCAVQAAMAARKALTAADRLPARVTNQVTWRLYAGPRGLTAMALVSASFITDRGTRPTPMPAKTRRPARGMSRSPPPRSTRGRARRPRSWPPPGRRSRR